MLWGNNRRPRLFMLLARVCMWWAVRFGKSVFQSAILLWWQRDDKLEALGAEKTLVLKKDAALFLWAGQIPWRSLVCFCKCENDHLWLPILCYANHPVVVFLYIAVRFNISISLRIHVKLLVNENGFIKHCTYASFPCVLFLALIEFKWHSNLQHTFQF